MQQLQHHQNNTFLYGNTTLFVWLARAVFLFGALFFGASFAYASATVGTVSTVHKYAWSNVGGYVNFAPLHSHVTVTDSALSGYAWSANDGWINLSPAYGGVRNNGKGVLSGFAWDETAGWVNFSGVTIDSSGVFHGRATGGTVNGASYVINFSCSSCDVQTDWRPASERPQGAIGVTFTNSSPSFPPTKYENRQPPTQASSTASSTFAGKSIHGIKTVPSQAMSSKQTSGNTSAFSFGNVTSIFNSLFHPRHVGGAIGGSPTVSPSSVAGSRSSFGVVIHRVLLSIGVIAVALFAFLLFRFFF